MAIKTFYYYWFSILFFGISTVSAQQLVVVNGGLFGSQTDFANIGIFNSVSGTFTTLDTIYTNSVQDVLIEENRYIYVAAQDSIVKYDLWTAERLSAAAFGAASTIRLGLYNDKLLVGNWYGTSEGNLRIFDKNDLSFTDSIPEISKGATDFLIIGNRAYIAQNNVNANWSDTLGYIAVVDLDLNQFLHNDTLSTSGDEIGRLVNVGDSVLYSINGVSSTISTLHLANGSKNSVAAAAVLNPKSTGASVFFDGTKWYLPFNNGIGTYDLINNAVITADIVIPLTYSYGFAVDPTHDKIYISTVDFSNQANNQGLIYNLNGDSTGVFPVGFSPEVLGILQTSIAMQNSSVDNDNFNIQIFPNPVSDLLNVKSSDKIERLEILDLNGRIIAQLSTMNKEAQISVSALPKGIYLLRTGDKVQKFVKV
jgi:hypothetical protein